MEVDNNTFDWRLICPLERNVVPNFVYVGHPIKILFERGDSLLIAKTTEFIERIAILLKAHTYTPLIPALIGHNVDRPKDFDMKQVYLRCAKASRISSLFIAIAIGDSTGLGMEYQIAYANHIPIVILSDNKVRVTGMINPNFATILSYNDHNHGIELLDKHLSNNSYHENFAYYSFKQEQ